MCPRGSESSSGMEPCRPCSIDTYSDIIGSKSCTKCIDGFGTPYIGSTEYTDCEG